MMNERIAALADRTVRGEMYVHPVKTEYDAADLALSERKRSAKRVCEYILNQEPLITEDSCFTGLIKFDGSVEGDIFGRAGFSHFAELRAKYYNRPIENLLTFEWQHSVGNFERIIKNGLCGIKSDIVASKHSHADDADAVEFLDTQTDFCNAVIGYAHKCAARVADASVSVTDGERKKNLLRLSDALKRVPEFPAAGFYEAVLSLYFVYGYIPDSIGLIDRYLYPYFKQDIACGNITRDEAKAYLQELFLMLQARISIKSDRFYRGGETHFCIGGYTPEGEDGFNELSRLIVEALMELPTWIPQISLRWTKKTPRETFAFMLDCERKDTNKRIAFVNDEPRIKGLTEYAGFSYPEAVSYTMMGCNELAMPGGMVLGFDPFNIAHSLEGTFFGRRSDILAARDFAEFFAVYREELFHDLDRANTIGKMLQDERSRDTCIVSNIFIDGCIENAKSITKGGGTKFIAVGLPIGLTTVIDSLTVIKQFVYDEQVMDMAELCRALDANWKGYETQRLMILQKTKFFGNDEDVSNGIARKLLSLLRVWNTGDNYLGKKWLFGNLIGYNEHHKFFGEGLFATPDGRFAGDPISFGIGQSNGKDRNDLTALLNSIATCDPDAVLTGPSVTNLTIEEELIKNDKSFEKLVCLLETYFRQGGTHFQLTYASKEDLIRAQSDPDSYKHLRVRVSGFADYFVNLNQALQDDVIRRTVH